MILLKNSVAFHTCMNSEVRWPFFWHASSTIYFVGPYKSFFIWKSISSHVCSLLEWLTEERQLAFRLPVGYSNIHGLFYKNVQTIKRWLFLIMIQKRFHHSFLILFNHESHFPHFVLLDPNHTYSCCPNVSIWRHLDRLMLIWHSQNWQRFVWVTQTCVWQSDPDLGITISKLPFSDHPFSAPKLWVLCFLRVCLPGTSLPSSPLDFSQPPDCVSNYGRFGECEGKLDFSRWNSWIPIPRYLFFRL